MTSRTEDDVAADTKAQPQVLGAPEGVLYDSDLAIAAALQAEEDARAASQIGQFRHHTIPVTPHHMILNTPHDTIPVTPDDIRIVSRQTSRRLIWFRRAIVIFSILGVSCIVGYFAGLDDVLRGLRSGASQDSLPAVSQEALQGTNRYRASKGMREVLWHDGIAMIAVEHATQMATGQAPFSHDGFGERIASFSFEYRAAGENLARCPGRSKPSECAVTGWIESPGHEKNLVNSDWTLCGIGTAQSPDEKYFFLTQLFAATTPA